MVLSSCVRNDDRIVLRRWNVYNAIENKIQNTQHRKKQNTCYASADLREGSDNKDYAGYLSDGRNIWQRVWKTEIGTTVQNDYETVVKIYTKLVLDYCLIPCYNASISNP